MCSLHLILQDKVVQFVIKQIRQYPEVTRAFLFGSRARGDAKERSDYDFAFEALGIFEDRWSQLVLDLEENTPTLCSLDFLRMDARLSRPELLEHILKEGIQIYG